MVDPGVSTGTSIMISVFLIIVGLFLSIVASMMAYYFKQLRKSVDEYRASVEKRMGEGDERFCKIEESMMAFRSEVYKDYVTKPDLIRIMGSLEFKFKEIMTLIEKEFVSIRERKSDER